MKMKETESTRKKRPFFTVSNLAAALLCFAAFLAVGLGGYYIVVGEFVSAELAAIYAVLALVGGIAVLLRLRRFTVLYYLGCALGWAAGWFVSGLKGAFAPTAGNICTFFLIGVFTLFGVIFEGKGMKKRMARRKEERARIEAAAETARQESELEQAKQAEACGADGILMVTPYYNKTTQKGLVEHFTYVADRVDIPMIVYNVPSRTSIGIKSETYKKLSEHPNINGVKEASGDFSLFAMTRALCGDDLYIWSGNDDNTVPMMAMGALGVISVASNIVPGAVAKLCSLCLEGNFDDAQKLSLIHI